MRDEKQALKLEVFKAVTDQLARLTEEDRERVLASVVELWPLKPRDGRAMTLARR